MELKVGVGNASGPILFFVASINWMPSYFTAGLSYRRGVLVARFLGTFTPAGTLYWIAY